MIVIPDVSVVVTALVDLGELGDRARARLSQAHLAAPHVLPVEVTNALRRMVLRGSMGAEAATLAQADLPTLSVELFPFEPFSDRVWELRGGLTSYDAWYVAVAEELDAPLVTLDRRLARAPGVRCEVITPQA